MSDALADAQRKALERFAQMLIDYGDGVSGVLMVATLKDGSVPFVEWESTYRDMRDLQNAAIDWYTAYNWHSPTESPEDRRTHEWEIRNANRMLNEQHEITERLDYETRNPHACDHWITHFRRECGQRFKTERGLKMHKARSHRG